MHVENRDRKAKRGFNPPTVKNYFVLLVYGNLCERIKSARRICARPVAATVGTQRDRDKEREKERGTGGQGEKRNKNGNDARDIIDRLNRRSFARLLFEK